MKAVEMKSTIDEISDIPVDGLLEICNAERDGRLVVLPYTIGTTVFITPHYPAYWDDIEETKINGVAVFANGNSQMTTDMGLCVNIDHVGKTVFLTKAEAEQALSNINSHEHEGEGE